MEVKVTININGCDGYNIEKAQNFIAALKDLDCKVTCYIDSIPSQIGKVKTP